MRGRCLSYDMSRCRQNGSKGSTTRSLVGLRKGTTIAQLPDPGPRTANDAAVFKIVNHSGAPLTGASAGRSDPSSATVDGPAWQRFTFEAPAHSPFLAALTLHLLRYLRSPINYAAATIATNDENARPTSS